MPKKEPIEFHQTDEGMVYWAYTDANGDVIAHGTPRETADDSVTDLQTLFMGLQAWAEGYGGLDQISVELETQDDEDVE